MDFLFGSERDHSTNVSSEKHNGYSELKYSAWRIINAVMGSFFAFAAFVQINDPDSAVWIMLYIIPSLICITLAVRPAIQGKWNFKMLCLFYTVLCFFGIIYSLYQGSEEIIKQKSNIFAAEEAREAAGLAIVVSWLLMVMLIDSQNIQTMTLASWMKITSVAMIPFLSALVWLYTVDMAQVPKHCRGILTGL